MLRTVTKNTGETYFYKMLRLPKGPTVKKLEQILIKSMILDDKTMEEANFPDLIKKLINRGEESIL